MQGRASIGNRPQRHSAQLKKDADDLFKAIAGVEAAMNRGRM
jgi:hypothetical protein